MFSCLKKIYLRAMSMCDKSYIIFRYSLILSCILACSALICLIVFEHSGARLAKNLAADMIELPAAILLVSVLGSAIIEDIGG